MNKIIEVIVSPKGETKITTKGFNGQSCKDASKFLETALGETLNEQHTAEYYVYNNHSQQMEINQ